MGPMPLPGPNLDRLRVVSNFGDGDCGADETHTRARNFEETRREGSAKKIFGAPFASRLLELSHARVYFARPTIAIAKIRDYSQSKTLRTRGNPFSMYFVENQLGELVLKSGQFILSDQLLNSHDLYLL